jgi:hypothetical protein
VARVFYGEPYLALAMRSASTLENLAGCLATLKANIAELYGEPFVTALTAEPVSQFIAEGSDVQVWRRSEDPILAQAMAAGVR